jgi:hypothetical protein
MRSITPNRQLADADSLFIENNNAASLQCVYEVWQIRQKQRQLRFGTPLRYAPQQNDRWSRLLA